MIVIILDTNKLGIYNMDYKKLFELLNNLPDDALKDLSDIVRKNKEDNPNITYEDAKAQIESFKKLKENTN